MVVDGGMFERRLASDHDVGNPGKLAINEIAHLSNQTDR
jgi:hypothetical protein